MTLYITFVMTNKGLVMSKIEFRISDEKKTKLKSYCTEHEITVSKLLVDYVDTLLSKSGNAGKAPVSKKNSVKYQYCDCGIDLFTLPPQDRLLHVQNCKNGQKE